MLIWEYPTTDAALIHRDVAGCGADAESYVRDDSKGSLVVCASDGAKLAGDRKSVV